MADRVRPEHTIQSHGRSIDSTLVWYGWDCLTCGRSFASEQDANDHRDHGVKSGDDQ